MIGAATVQLFPVSYLSSSGTLHSLLVPGGPVPGPIAPEFSADLVKTLAVLELGVEIPEPLYRAVAEMLAFVYRISRNERKTARVAHAQRVECGTLRRRLALR